MGTSPPSNAARALITGATGGIGRATALQLARAGFDLILHVRQADERLTALQNELDALGRNHVSWIADLTEPNLPTETLREQLRATPATAFVHAAGGTAEGLAARPRPNQLDALHAVHVRAFAVMAAEALRGMLRARTGRIVAVGSTAALAGNAGQSAYAAVKAALGGYVRSLAREVAARGVTANLVAPGWIETPMTDAILNARGEEIRAQIPAGRTGDAGEVAALIAFLCSREAGYITGQTIAVNGGLWMH